MYLLDLAYYIKVKGKPAKLYPSWTTLGGTFGLNVAGVKDKAKPGAAPVLYKETTGAGQFDLTGRMLTNTALSNAKVRIRREPGTGKTVLFMPKQ